MATTIVIYIIHNLVKVLSMEKPVMINKQLMATTTTQVLVGYGFRIAMLFCKQRYNHC